VPYAWLKPEGSIFCAKPEHCSQNPTWLRALPAEFAQQQAHLFVCFASIVLRLLKSVPLFVGLVSCHRAGWIVLLATCRPLVLLLLCFQSVSECPLCFLLCAPSSAHARCTYLGCKSTETPSCIVSKSKPAADHCRRALNYIVVLALG
jgi:hypothetical protein